ncbi:TetR/AcrR family transcriptional regulator [Streptosporangium fragile]|uniref:TetR/AcrR family transcriptional regulator n=1 Tax=Streptosporangium fragile TaxID=46186 RepID=A0ABN3WC95_9ACTN
MPARRTPTVALSRERIVTACLELVEGGGPGALTFRAIGRRLGVDATAVYRHFRDKDDLVLALADRLYEEALAGFAPSDDWAETLRDVVLRIHRAFAGHPQAALLAATRSTRREAEFRAIEILLDALRRAGFGPEEAARYERVLGDYALAWAAFTASFAMLPKEVREADASAPLVYAAQSLERYPRLAECARHLPPVAESQFETALEILLTGLRVSSRPPAGAVPDASLTA